jgi:hypothetical protein
VLETREVALAQAKHRRPDAIDEHRPFRLDERQAIAAAGFQQGGGGGTIVGSELRREL